MPDEAEMITIKTNFTNSLKCPEPNYLWTSWNSYTNLSETGSDGNDYETLNLHRSKFQKFVIQEILAPIFKSYISVFVRIQ